MTRPITIAGHVAEEGSPAARWLARAERSRYCCGLDRAAGAVHCAAQDVRDAGRRIARATAARGYLHPAPLALTPNP
jgi:hypothetical protein